MKRNRNTRHKLNVARGDPGTADASAEQRRPVHSERGQRGQPWPLRSPAETPSRDLGQLPQPAADLPQESHREKHPQRHPRPLRPDHCRHQDDGGHLRGAPAARERPREETQNQHACQRGADAVPQERPQQEPLQRDLRRRSSESQQVSRALRPQLGEPRRRQRAGLGLPTAAQAFDRFTQSCSSQTASSPSAWCCST